MRWWPFGKRKEAEVVPQQPSHSAMDLLLCKDCGRDEFLLLYVKLLEERIPGAELVMTGDSSVRIIHPRGKESTVFLDNAWVSYARGKDSRRELLDRHVRVAAVVDVVDPFRPDRLVIRIKDVQFMQQFNQNQEMAAEHLCGDLWISYTEDLPDRMRSVKWEVLEKAAIARGELKELAKTNLLRILPPAERHGDGPWYLLTAGGDYTASLLILDAMWDDLAESVDGNIVAVVPSRDVLLYTGSESVEGIAAIRERAAEVLATGNYLISGTLLMRVGGRWEVFNVN